MFIKTNKLIIKMKVKCPYCEEEFEVKIQTTRTINLNQKPIRGGLVRPVKFVGEGLPFSMDKSLSKMKDIRDRDDVKTDL